MFFSRCLRIFSFPPFLCVYLNIFQVFSNRLVDLRFHPAGPEFDPVAATGNQSSLTRNIFIGLSNESTLRKKSQYLRWCLFYLKQTGDATETDATAGVGLFSDAISSRRRWSAGRWSARPKWTMKACQTPSDWRCFMSSSITEGERRTKSCVILLSFMCSRH